VSASTQAYGAVSAMAVVATPRWGFTFVVTIVLLSASTTRALPRPGCGVFGPRSPGGVGPLGREGGGGGLATGGGGSLAELRGPDLGPVVAVETGMMTASPASAGPRRGISSSAGGGIGVAVHGARASATPWGVW